MSEKEINKFDLASIKENSLDGYILEVDLEYSSELHNLHNDYPLALEKLKINQNMLSKYCSDIANKYGIKIDEVNKLVPNLGNKEQYVIHYRNLQLYLSLRMKLTKVHRILKFKQSNYFKKFVDFNTEKRKNVINDFGKNFFKLKIFSKNFVAIHKIKAVLKLNKPIYVGFSILELSKLLMYDFHYGYFKNKFDAKLLFTDTDSLVYEIKGEEDAYEKFYLDKGFLILVIIHKIQNLKGKMNLKEM